jgi:hypothetical protein
MASGFGWMSGAATVTWTTQPAGGAFSVMHATYSSKEHHSECYRWPRKIREGALASAHKELAKTDARKGRTTFAASELGLPEGNPAAALAWRRHSAAGRGNLDRPAKFQARKLTFAQAIFLNDLATSLCSSADCVVQPLTVFSQNGHANSALDARRFQTVGQSGSALDNSNIRGSGAHGGTPSDNRPERPDVTPAPIVVTSGGPHTGEASQNSVVRGRRSSRTGNLTLAATLA